jgi:lipoprotein signal peptidase
LIDRIYLKCVIDFIQLPFWPIFNLADFFISIACIFLLVRIAKM